MLENNFKINDINFDSLKYVLQIIKRNSKLEHKLYFLYVLFNIISILGSFVVVVITTIFVSKLVWQKWEEWYYFFSIGFSAGITFIMSLLNFFVIKQKYLNIQIQKNKILAEITFYKNYKSGYVGTENKRNYKLFLHVSAIMGSELAKKELNVNK